MLRVKCVHGLAHTTPHLQPRLHTPTNRTPLHSHKHKKDTHTFTDRKTTYTHLAKSRAAVDADDSRSRERASERKPVLGADATCAYVCGQVCVYGTETCGGC